MHFRRIETLINFTKGKKPLNTSKKLNDGYLPYVDIKAFETGVIDNYTDGEKCVSCQDGDLLIVCDGSRSGLVGKAVDGYVGSTLAKIDVNDEIDICYLYYFIQGKYQILNTNVKGTGTPHLKQDLLKSFEIYLPSLAEQQRIVTKIEELFSKLDKGVEELNKIKEQLKIYRQAVLKEAFSGELTRDKNINRDVISLYRTIKEQNNCKFKSEEIPLYDLPNGWMWVHIGDLTDGVEYGSSKKSQKSGLVPVLRMGNIQNGRFDWSDLAYSSDEGEINKYLLRKNDVLFNRTNSPELVGKTAIYKGEHKAIFAGYLIRINQYEYINAMYLNYYLNSFTAKAYGNLVKTDGVNQSNINGKKLCSYPFPLCTVDEQELVVKEIESRLSVCDKIEQTVNESLQKAESLKQGILKQAFEGKLV